jgi:hypothetical protein
MVDANSLGKRSLQATSFGSRVYQFPISSLLQGLEGQRISPRKPGSAFEKNVRAHLKVDVASRKARADRRICYSRAVQVQLGCGSRPCIGVEVDAAAWKFRCNAQNSAVGYSDKSVSILTQSERHQTWRGDYLDLQYGYTVTMKNYRSFLVLLLLLRPTPSEDARIPLQRACRDDAFSDLQRSSMRLLNTLRKPIEVLHVCSRSFVGVLVRVRIAAAASSGDATSRKTTTMRIKLANRVLEALIYASEEISSETREGDVNGCVRGGLVIGLPSELGVEGQSRVDVSEAAIPAPPKHYQANRTTSPDLSHSSDTTQITLGSLLNVLFNVTVDMPEAPSMFFCARSWRRGAGCASSCCKTIRGGISFRKAIALASIAIEGSSSPSHNGISPKGTSPTSPQRPSQRKTCSERLLRPHRRTIAPNPPDTSIYPLTKPRGPSAINCLAVMGEEYHCIRKANNRHRMRFGGSAVTRRARARHGRDKCGSPHVQQLSISAPDLHCYASPHL